jgi:CheY-like chemotaxis protein
LEKNMIALPHSGADTATRILILEDRSTDEALMEFELREGGINFTHKWVKTEKEYVSALEDFSPDLILSDFELPQYDGSLALAEAKMRCAHVPFILVTGILSDHDRLEAILAQGAKGYVLKDRLDQLVPAVKRALGLNGHRE